MLAQEPWSADRAGRRSRDHPYRGWRTGVVALPGIRVAERAHRTSLPAHGASSCVMYRPWRFVTGESGCVESA